MDIFLSPIVFPIAIVAFILLMLLIIFVTKYQTAKPDEALIISGSYLGNKMFMRMRAITKSKSCVVVEPLFCQCSNDQTESAYFSSKLDVSTPEVYTEQGVPAYV